MRVTSRQGEDGVWESRDTDGKFSDDHFAKYAYTTDYMYGSSDWNTCYNVTLSPAPEIDCEATIYYAGGAKEGDWTAWSDTLTEEKTVSVEIPK